MAANVIQISDQEFETKVLKADKPVIVDFWAPWCGPCRAIAPVLEELANQYSDKVTVVKVNVDDNPASPGRYGVRGIPTLIAFRNGSVIDQMVGAAPDRLRQMFARVAA